MGSKANHSPIASGLSVPDTLTALTTALGALDAALVARLSGAILNVAVFRNQLARGVGAGASSAGTWHARTFTHVVNGGYTFYTSSAPEFTPEAGRYALFALLPAYDCGLHKARLLNVTQSSVVAYGINANAPTAANSMTSAALLTVFTANGTDEFRLEHYIQNTVSSNGLGVALDYTYIGDGDIPEIYEMFTLIKVKAV